MVKPFLAEVLPIVWRWKSYVKAPIASVAPIARLQGSEEFSDLLARLFANSGIGIQLHSDFLVAPFR